MYHLAGAYMYDYYRDGDNIDAWYKYFKDYDIGIFHYAVCYWIRRESKRPYIADILRTMQDTAGIKAADYVVEADHVAYIKENRPWEKAKA